MLTEKIAAQTQWTTQEPELGWIMNLRDPAPSRQRLHEQVLDLFQWEGLYTARGMKGDG
jgi:hypothetical protein